MPHQLTLESIDEQESIHRRAEDRILREAEKSSVAEAAKGHGVSAETVYSWRRTFGGMDANEARRLKELERENARPKRLLAERDLEIDVMKEIAAKKW